MKTLFITKELVALLMVSKQAIQKRAKKKIGHFN